MKKILTVCFLVFFCSLLKAQVPASDSLALVALYQSMNGHLWTFRSNWLQTGRPVSTWFGVTVTNDTVTGINLDDNNLIGTIPAEIGDFTKLQTISLEWNDLIGNIPVEIGDLSNLQYLSLTGNKFDDSIPEEIGDLSNLQHLDLGYNELGGNIPTEIENLSNLQYLNLCGNDLNDSIFPGIGSLSNLTELILYNNELSGSIPAEIGNLTNLQYLDLSYNQLDDSIPSAIGNLSNLIRLTLNDNQLSGSIPPEIGNLANLQYLFSWNNQLDGSIPSAIGDLSNLIELMLHNNQLSGSIPAEIGNLDSLHVLYLGDNSLTGTIPSEIGNSSSLRQFDLSYNQLSGSIPSEIGNLSNLSFLNLRENQLSGNIPSEILNLPLIGFDVVNNNYTFSDFDSVTVVPLPAFLLYSPQNQIPVTTGQINKSAGDNLELNIINLADTEVAADSNRYQWWKDNDTITAYSGSPVLSIADLDTSDQGYYYCTMINPEFPLLTLYTDSVFLGVDSVPYNITLTPNSVDENVSSGFVVGTLSAEDIDQTGGHIFTLTDGNGINDADNDSFLISGENLIINTSPDYETKDEYNIYVRATDDDLQTFDKALVVYVNDIDEGPVDITLAPDSVDENVGPGFVIGALSAEDVDQAGGHIFTLTDGNGINDADNGSFSISGENLIINTSPDYETKDEYNIYVRATDDDLQTFDKALVVYINDIEENDTTVTNIITKEEIQLLRIYPNPASSVLFIESDNESEVLFELYNLSGIKVLQQSINTKRQIIDISELSEGVYLFRIFKIGKQTNNGILLINR